jgi:hypothetical protein
LSVGRDAISKKEKVMIVEERIYTFHPHKHVEFIKIYETESIHILRKHLGRQIGFFSNEVGVQNTIIHMWAYDSYEDRQQRRHALGSDAAWVALRPKVQPLLKSQTTRIMIPPPFFEPMLEAMLQAGQNAIAAQQTD